MLPAPQVRLWMLPPLCLVGIGMSRLLLKRLSVKRWFRPRLFRLVVELRQRSETVEEYWNGCQQVHG